VGTRGRIPLGCLGPYLSAGMTLKGGDYLLSPNGQYSAVMQDDGNFVLYWDGGQIVSSARCGPRTPAARAGVTATMQTDGNLVLNGGWAKGTGGKTGPPFAAMQDNGDFALWLGTPANPASSYYTTGTWQGRSRWRSTARTSLMSLSWGRTPGISRRAGANPSGSPALAATLR
jgi:hypothetical protein